MFSEDNHVLYVCRMIKPELEEEDECVGMRSKDNHVQYVL